MDPQRRDIRNPRDRGYIAVECIKGLMRALPPTGSIWPEADRRFFLYLCECLLNWGHECVDAPPPEPTYRAHVLAHALKCTREP